MIIGIGADTVQINRFVSWIDNDQKIYRFFNAIDITYIKSIPIATRARSLAVRYAAKEAFGKAIGEGLRAFPLKDIAVRILANGKPQLALSNSALHIFNTMKGLRTHISLAHDGDHALAFVILEGAVE